MTGWQWDQTLFAGAARYYEQGRVPYPAALGAALASVVADPAHGRLLDVGCGPGSVCLRAAGHFGAVVGIDADPDMVIEAARIASGRGIGNARFQHLRAEPLPAGLGGFDVVTFANSFHWLDRLPVARAVTGMLRPGGAVVHVDEDRGARTEPSLPHPRPPQNAIAELIRRFLGPHRRAGQMIRETSVDGEDDIFRAAGLHGPSLVPLPDGRVLERTIDDVVAGIFSLSSSAPHLFGHRVGEFEGDLRNLLAAASPSGRFCVVVPDAVLKVWRPGASTRSTL